MNRANFINHVDQRTYARINLLRQKGQAYSGDDNAFANFERNAQKLGLTKYQIWAVYCGKHLDAIFGAIRRNPSHPVDPSEGLQGRIDDTVNYLDLLSGMEAEQIPTQTGDRQHLPSNAEIARRIASLLGGNDLSTHQQVELVKDLLDAFYGPRHFSF